MDKKYKKVTDNMNFFYKYGSESPRVSESLNEIVEEAIEAKKAGKTIGEKERIKTKEKDEIINILESIFLSRNKPEIKEHIGRFIKKMKDLGLPFYYKPDPKAPVFWSNLGSNDELLKNKEYNSKVNHYHYSDNKPMMILWDFIECCIMDAGELNFENTYCLKMFRECGGIDTSKGRGIKLPKNHIPYDKLLSEIWVETMPLDDIINGEFRIEFGQNIQGRSKDEVFFATDSVMATAELMILLRRINEYNKKMDLEGTPKKKISLENKGISIEEIITGNFKNINERYGKDQNGKFKNNKGAGYVLIKGVVRDPNQDGKIVEESIITPIKLQYLSLKYDKKILKEYDRRIKRNKERTPEDIRKEIHDLYSSEKKQHNFMEKARRGQEVNYLIYKELKENNHSFSTEEEKNSFIKKRRKELKRKFETGKSLINEDEENDYIEWVAKNQDELIKKEEEKISILKTELMEAQQELGNKLEALKNEGKGTQGVSNPA